MLLGNTWKLFSDYALLFTFDSYLLFTHQKKKKSTQDILYIIQINIRKIHWKNNIFANYLIYNLFTHFGICLVNFHYQTHTHNRFIYIKLYTSYNNHHQILFNFHLKSIFIFLFSFHYYFFFFLCLNEIPKKIKHTHIYNEERRRTKKKKLGFHPGFRYARSIIYKLSRIHIIFATFITTQKYLKY